MAKLAEPSVDNKMLTSLMEYYAIITKKAAEEEKRNKELETYRAQIDKLTKENTQFQMQVDKLQHNIKIVSAIAAILLAEKYKNMTVSELLKNEELLQKEWAPILSKAAELVKENG